MKIAILVAAFLGGALFFVEPAAAANAYTTASVYMHSEPTASARTRITVVPRGRAVIVRNCGGGWCSVIWRGKRGWISSRYISSENRQPRVRRYAPHPGVIFNFDIYGRDRYRPRDGDRRDYRGSRTGDRNTDRSPGNKNPSCWYRKNC
ncbi:MAG: SH3 domain-containing protein [Rhodobiaceae bacterium]|nr:SH3 domain-containing protein [Rhodobiaceae bacterium]